MFLHLLPQRSWLMRAHAGTALAVLLISLVSCEVRQNRIPPGVPVVRHRVAIGDTLSSLAERYQVTVRAIGQANDLQDVHLAPGEILLIPGGREVIPEPIIAKPATAAVPDTSWFQPRSAWAKAPVIASRSDPMTAPYRITVHHSGLIADASDSPVEVLTRIEREHTSPRHGWAAIGYHFVIDAAGTIWEARPLAYQGAHAGEGNVSGNANKNTGNIGVCLLGDFNRSRLPRAQTEALLTALERLRARYRIGMREVHTHNELKTNGSTDCPGRNLQVFIDAYRGGIDRDLLPSDAR